VRRARRGGGERGGAHGYLEISAVLMGLENAVFALVLVVALRQRAKAPVQAA
jgi:hypothetical protein